MAPCRKSYPAGFKIEVIKFAKENSNRVAARHYGISETNIRNWRKQEDSLSICKKSRRANRGQHARWPELEISLEKWMLDQRTSGRAISITLICTKAQELAKQLNLTDFLGRQSWYSRFMHRRKLCLRTGIAVGHDLPNNYEEELVRFKKYCAKEIAEYDISSDHIISMDEIPMTLKMPFKRTVDLKGSCNVTMEARGRVESSFTLVLAITAAGTKLPPMVIFKRKALPEEKFPHGITVLVNEKGAVDFKMFKTWITRCYSKRPGGSKHNRRALLIMNGTRTYATDDAKTLLSTKNTTPVLIPEGFAPLLQPLDNGVNESFETNVKTPWEQWMSDAKNSFIETGRFRIATYSQLCEWILDSWGSITPECIKRGFQAAGVIQRDVIPEDSFKDSKLVDPPSLTCMFDSDTDDEQFDGF